MGVIILDKPSTTVHDKYFKKRIDPSPAHKDMNITELVDSTYFAYNSARLKECCQLGAKYFQDPQLTIGITLAGALIPAGLGISTIIPLIKAGLIDYIISTGANLYHDIHFALNYPLYQSHPFHNDVELRKEHIIRIYDILFSADVLYDSDAFVRDIVKTPPFQKKMGTSEFHYLMGKAVAQVEEQLGTVGSSILAACYRYNVPVYTSSPGESTFGLNLAAQNLLEESSCSIDPSIDVNETSAIVWEAQSSGGKSAVVILGGGSPKNFILQTEPQLQEILGLPARGHDYFIQFTDSRVDTGGLSGATPSEALSWGKIDPEGLSRTIVAYIDSTVAVPIFTAYLLSKIPPKPLKEYYKQLPRIMTKLKADAQKHVPPVEKHQLSDTINL